MTDYEPCLRSPDPSERCMLPYKHEGPCRFDGDLKREDVARVLAESWFTHRHKTGALDSWDDGYLSGIEDSATDMKCKAEFESALKALEEEASRG